LDEPGNLSAGDNPDLARAHLVVVMREDDTALRPALMDIGNLAQGVEAVVSLLKG
jgi:hypothetical protein